MNLYRIWQDANVSTDTYDSAIVAAPSKIRARETKPDQDHRTWCHPEAVQVELIGKAKPGTKAGVILASFNAG